MTGKRIQDIVRQYNPDAPVIQGTLQEIEHRFPTEYLAVIITKEDEMHQAQEGVLLYHAHSREKLSAVVSAFEGPYDLFIISPVRRLAQKQEGSLGYR
jgi:hypothetical protein